MPEDKDCEPIYREGLVVAALVVVSLLGTIGCLLVVAVLWLLNRVG